MYVHVDLSQVPPVLELREAEDFTRFHVEVAAPSHSWVTPDGLAALAGRAGDVTWLKQLDGMLRFADSKGWLDADGRVRAHVEVTRSNTSSDDAPAH